MVLPTPTLACRDGLPNLTDVTLACRDVQPDLTDKSLACRDVQPDPSPGRSIFLCQAISKCSLVETAFLLLVTVSTVCWGVKQNIGVDVKVSQLLSARPGAENTMQWGLGNNKYPVELAFAKTQL